jgi:SAM-dependent methyltransferase
MLNLVLRVLRKLLKSIEIALDSATRTGLPSSIPGNGLETSIENFLAALSLPAEERPYFNSHLRRLIRSFSLVPLKGRSALELGTYVYGSAVLQRVLGYQEVRGAYFSDKPGRNQKTLALNDQPEFVLDIDLFDAERHTFPYPSSSFDLVICCELIEHLVLDPMHLLFECHRVLGEGGCLLLTTPNAASLHSVASALHGRNSPQVFSAYPASGNCDVPHVREYTASELSSAVTAAGFEIELLTTEPIAGFENSRWALELLRSQGFDTSLRGEQTFCLARRRAALPQERHPRWLYAG